MWSKMNLSQRQLELFVSLFLLLISCVMSTINISDFNKITEIQSIVSQSRQVSPKYRFRVNKVDSCPSANNTWYEAGVRLNCSHDVHNRLQYLCIPNQEKTTLLEFCYDKIMGLYEKGKCLHLSTSGFVDQEDCSMFFEGCPKIPYFSSNIFKFLKCLDINRDLRCFVADPDCHFRTDHILTKNCSVMSGSCNSTTIVPKPEPKADNWNIGKIMILLMSIIAIPPIMIWCMAKSIKNKSWIRVKQRRNTLKLVPYSTRCTANVTWKKNGEIIDRSKNIDKFTINSNCLYIHNLTEEDKGDYHAVASCRFKRHTHIDIDTAHLFGFETAFTDESKFDYNDQQFTPHLESKEIYVVILKTTTMSKSSKIIFTKETRSEEDKKLWFHTIILLSKNTSLSLINDREDLKKIGVETQKRLFKDSTFCHNLVEEPVAATSLWNSIVLEDNVLKFANEDVEIETLCVLFQKCSTPMSIINYIFELKNSKLLLKYFRLKCYQRVDKEVCIYLPNYLSDRYITTLLNITLQETKFKGTSTQSEDINRAEQNTEMEFSKKKVREIEDSFHQPTATVVDTVLFYCFIKNAVTKSYIEKVFRSSGYVRKEKGKYICLSPDFTKKLIERMDTDILIHKTISDSSIHSIVSEQLRIPEEVLKWDYDARKRFVEKIGKDAEKIYRSRGMIVGCAGAGKTTLLERLLNRDLVELPKTESTVGLDIHDSLFKISDETNKMIALSGDDPYKEEKTLSITDFAGQSAYYACHQVYLSRRALYILVIDLSKNPNEPVSSEQNFSREKLFENWTYRDYNKFWMESISTYCDTASPVILVGTHKDVANEHTVKNEDRFCSFLSQLPDVSQLQQHLHRKNYFELGKPGESRDEMDRLEKCIVEMVKKQSTWGEIVPKLWKDFDQELCKFKIKRIITISDLINSNNCKIPKQNEDVLDMLRFYHDCGKILFFNETGLSDIVILDVQWFVDAFKNVITDENHRTHVSSKEWTSFNETGMLEDKHLLTIWTELGLHEMIEYKDTVLLYMQRLGLIAVGKGKLYVPSVNKQELCDKDFERIKRTKHTSILKFSFPKFLPHFYFYRLVVASMEHWESQEDGKLPLLFKNAAFFKYTDNCHRIVLGVSSTQIHLQIYTCNSKPLKKDVTLNIRQKIESFLEQLTRTFHKPVEYYPGFTCKPTNVTEESDDAVFIRESEAVEFYSADPSESSSPCPRHNRDEHNLSWKQMLKYWTKKTDKQDTCCQRLFSCRRSHVPRNRYIKWDKEDIDVEKGESSVKFI